jgi:hypothetical protein
MLPVLGAPVFSAHQCPARGRRVQSAACGRVACDQLRRPWTRRPLTRGFGGCEETGADQEQAKLTVLSIWPRARCPASLGVVPQYATGAVEEEQLALQRGAAARAVHDHPGVAG